MEQATDEIDRGNTERAVELAECAFALDADNEDARAIVAFARLRARRRAGDAPARRAEVAPGAAVVDDPGARRRLTVLFCDVVGSTELAGRLDPEDVRELLREFQAVSAAAIESYGGTVARFMGDGILAYFGFPAAHEDDAARAALAGLAMVNAIDAVDLRTGAEATAGRLSIRVGIHTGLVVVATMGGGKRVEHDDVIGETPNVAARIQGEAPPGQVLISEATLELARPFIEVEEHGAPSLKGVARRMQLYRVIGERSVVWRGDVSIDAAGPLLGRDHEQACINEAWSRVPGQGGVVFLRGDAGIGKSRLVARATEVARDDGALVLVMQCASLRNSESLWPIDQSINAFAATAAPEYRALLEGVLPTEPDSITASPAKQREQRFDALIEWIDALADSQRLLVVVEDLHWADATTLEFVQRISVRAPLGRCLLLLTSRDPLYFHAEHVEPLHLQPLSADDCALMIEHLVDDPEQRRAVREAVISRSDGVPLFVNELTKVVVGSGSQSLELSDDHSVPVALHDLLVARVDQFTEQRNVAQALAAFGQPTEVGLLTAVLDQPGVIVLRDLNALEAGGLIRRVVDRYEFVHVLLREAVLRLQLRPQRRALHQRIAVALDHARATDTSVGDAIVAHHYSLAGDNARAAQLRLRAGQHALRRNAHVEATELLRAALASVENLPELPERTVAELDIVMALLPALVNSKGYGAAEVEDVCQRAYELCEVVGDVPQRVPALINLWNFIAARARHDEALTLSSTIMGLAEASGRDDLVLQASVCVGTSLAYIGRFQVALDYFDRALEMYDATRHASIRFEYGTDPAVLALAYSTTLNLFMGNDAGARECSQQCEALARTLAHPFSEMFALCWVAQYEIFAGDFESAELRLCEVDDLCAREAIPAMMPLLFRAMLQAERGEPSAAEACQLAIDIARLVGFLVSLPLLEAMQADALSARGDHDAAAARMQASLEAMNATNERWAEPETYRLCAQLLQRRGAPAAEVEDCYRRAIDIARGMGAAGLEARVNENLTRWLDSSQ